MLAREALENSGFTDIRDVDEEDRLDDRLDHARTDRLR